MLGWNPLRLGSGEETSLQTGEIRTPYSSISARPAGAELMQTMPWAHGEIPTKEKPPALWVARGRIIICNLIYKKEGAQVASLQSWTKTRPPGQTVPGGMFYNNE
jgi:hypothetical protein